MGLSVMSIKKKARRIDLDTEEHIYHLKVRSISTELGGKKEIKYYYWIPHSH